MNWADALGAVFTGGLTGILGSGLQFLGKYFSDRQDHKFQLEMRKVDMESTKLEAELAVRRAEQEAAATMALAEQASFDKSFDNDKATYSSNVTGMAQWVLVSVDAIRGLVRPVLTLWLCYLTGRVYAQTMALTGGIKSFDIAQLYIMLDNVINSILYIGSTVILWWFGTRPNSKVGGTKG